MISRNQVRIAMWSGPRNISTAMMRSFENRGDTSVIDEPFYAFYLSHSGLEHPGKEDILKFQSTNWDEVVRLITGKIPDDKFIWYQKHMVHHIANEKDIDWLKNFHNCFLIRHPREVIISYAKQAPINEITDLGFIQQVDLFKRILSLTGETPFVFEAKDILIKPEKHLKKMCEYFNINFTRKMLKWPKGERRTDGVWSQYWYKNVINSDSFFQYRDFKEEVPSSYKNLLSECLSYYEYLRSFKK